MAKEWHTCVLPPVEVHLLLQSSFSRHGLTHHFLFPLLVRRRHKLLQDSREVSRGQKGRLPHKAEADRHLFSSLGLPEAHSSECVLQGFRWLQADKDVGIAIGSSIPMNHVAGNLKRPLTCWAVWPICSRDMRRKASTLGTCITKHMSTMSTVLSIPIYGNGMVRGALRERSRGRETDRHLVRKEFF